MATRSYRTTEDKTDKRLTGSFTDLPVRWAMTGPCSKRPHFSIFSSTNINLFSQTSQTLAWQTTFRRLVLRTTNVTLTGGVGDTRLRSAANALALRYLNGKSPAA